MSDHDDELVEVVARGLHGIEDSWNDHNWEQLPPTVQSLFTEQARAAITAINLPARLAQARDDALEEAAGIVEACFEDKEQDYDDDEQSAWTDGAVFVQYIAAKAIRARKAQP